MATAMALAKTDKIKAVNCVNTTFKSIMLDLKYQGKNVVPGFKIHDVTNFITSIGDDLFSMENFEQKNEGFTDFDERIIDYSISKAPFLFVAGDNDRVSNARLLSEIGRKIAEKRMKENVEFVIYPGMGHLLDLPFSAVAPAASHPVIPKPGKILYGGHDLEMHSMGQEQAWPKIIDFFRQHLTISKAKL